MDIKTVKLSEHPGIKNMILCAFPDYRKQKAMVSFFPENGININSFWDGGSKDEYAIVHIPTMQKKVLPTRTHPFFEVSKRGMSNAENSDVLIDDKGNITLKRLPEGFVLIRTGTFVGKPATAHVYISNSKQKLLEDNVG